MKHLRDIVEKAFEPQAKTERDLYNLHNIEKIADRNGNGDDVFKGTNVNTFKRKSNRFGQEPTNQDGNIHKDNPLQKNVKMVATEEVSEELSKTKCLKPVDKKINDRAKSDLATYLMAKRYGKPTEKKVTKEEVEPVEEAVSAERMKLATMKKDDRKDQKDWDGSKTFSTREVEKPKTEFKPKTSASDIVKKFRSKVSEEKVEEISTKTLTSYSRKATKEFNSGDLDTKKEENRDKGIGLANDKINDAKRIISKPKTKVPASEAIMQLAQAPLLVSEIDSSKPENREIGTDSLVSILKSETPGETVTKKKKSISELSEGILGKNL